MTYRFYKGAGGNEGGNCHIFTPPMGLIPPPFKSPTFVRQKRNEEEELQLCHVLEKDPCPNCDEYHATDYLELLSVTFRQPAPKESAGHREEK